MCPRPTMSPASDLQHRDTFGVITAVAWPSTPSLHQGRWSILAFILDPSFGILQNVALETWVK
jgi:hypothetical protein